MFGSNKARGSKLYPKKDKGKKNVQFLIGYDYWFRVVVSIARPRR